VKVRLWLGVLVLLLGIASLFVAIPRTERQGIKAGNIDIGLQTRHDERVPPIVSAVLIAGGVLLVIVGGRKSGS
jgi:hypothetical protein